MEKKANSLSETIHKHEASYKGNWLQELVEHTLKTFGYIEFSRYKKQILPNYELLGGRQYVKQIFVGKTIYGNRRKVDFFLINKRKFSHGLIIECKWQKSPGSVDEKYPFVLHNILEAGIPTLVLLDGGGYKATAQAWFKKQVGCEGKEALTGVWSADEFQQEVHDGFLEEVGFSS